MARANLLNADLVAGAVLVVAGAAAFRAALGYGLGSTAFIGPGALPAAVSALVLICGLALMVPGRPDAVRKILFRLRPTLCIVGAIVGWIWLTPRIGLAGGTFTLVMLATLAQDQPRWLPALGTAVVLSLLGGWMFISLLGIQLPLVRWP